jgi:hypothetical protein
MNSLKLKFDLSPNLEFVYEGLYRSIEDTDGLIWFDEGNYNEII